MWPPMLSPGLPVFGPAPLAAEDTQEAAAFARAVREDAGLRSAPLMQRARIGYQAVLAAVRDAVDPVGSPIRSSGAAAPGHLAPAGHHGALGTMRLSSTMGHRMLVPPGARDAVVKELHKSHAGMVKTKLLAKQLYYWPNMGKDVEDKIRGCDACREDLPSQPAPPLVPGDGAGASVPGGCPGLFQVWRQVLPRHGRSVLGVPFCALHADHDDGRHDMPLAEMVLLVGLSRRHPVRWGTPVYRQWF
jgi:hypothetical protein